MSYRKKSLVFWQPKMSVAVKASVANLDEKKPVTKSIRASSYCRALLNTQLSAQLAKTLMEVRHGMKLNWYGEKVKTIVGYDRVKSLLIKETDDFCTLNIVSTALKKQERESGYWGYSSYTRDKGPIPTERFQDFYYLADLLCGTFGVLLDPRKDIRKLKAQSIPRAGRQAKSLNYRVSGPELLYHPAITALFLSQLRLAAFLTAAGEATTISQVIPRDELSAALKNRDREACIRFLRKAKRWVLRGEQGLWAFNSRSHSRYDTLLDYLEKGGTALSLFGRSIDTNWGLRKIGDGNSNFHNKGFTDFMRKSGDDKIYKE